MKFSMDGHFVWVKMLFLSILFGGGVLGGNFFVLISQISNQMRCPMEGKNKVDTVVECLMKCDLEDANAIYTTNKKCFCSKEVCTSPSIAVDSKDGMFYQNKRLELIKNEKIANLIILITTEATTTTVSDTTLLTTPTTKSPQTTTKTTIPPTATCSTTTPPQITTTTTAPSTTTAKFTTPSTTTAKTTTPHATTAIKTTPPAATITTTLSTTSTTTIPPDQCIFKLSDTATSDVDSNISSSSVQECITKCYQKKGIVSTVAGVCYSESENKCYCIRQTTNFFTTLGYNICFFPTTA